MPALHLYSSDYPSPFVGSASLVPRRIPLNLFSGALHQASSNQSCCKHSRPNGKHEGGVLTYKWDSVRDSGQFGFIWRLNVINLSDFLVRFGLQVKPVPLDDVPHSVIADDSTDEEQVGNEMGRNGAVINHFSNQDEHTFYLDSVYPTTINGWITYEWGQVNQFYLESV